MAALAPGTLVGRYRLDAVAGRGGMGVVYRATQLGLDRVVALKLIAPELAENAEFRERFRRESKTAASIEHPNVLPVYEADEADGRLYIAMRFVEGSDLATLLKSAGPLESSRALRLLKQVAAALDAAHQHGLVHRDVKPANVLIAHQHGTEHAYLTDFGLTKQVGSSTGFTKTGMWVGTLDYIAPEQITDAPVDARSDVYALACVLFQALTGRVPFPRERQEAKLYAHIHEPPPLLSELRPDLSEMLTIVLQRGMAKDPEARYPSAGDLGRAAEAALEGRDSSTPEGSVATGGAAPTRLIGTRPARPPPPRDRRPPGLRRRGLALLAGLALAAGTGAALFAAGVFDEDGIERINVGREVGGLDANAGEVVMERIAPDGSLLSRLDDEDNPVDLDSAANVVGVDAGLSQDGQRTIVYSRCKSDDGPCDIWQWATGGGDPKPVGGAAKERCNEVGPSLSGGVLIWRVRPDAPVASECGVPGLYVKQLGRPEERPHRLQLPTKLGGGSDIERPWIAWVRQNEGQEQSLGVARVSRGELLEQREIRGRGAHDFQGPSLAIDGGFIYFLDSARGRGYYIARTKLRRGAETFEHYARSFDSAPFFAVSEGDLYFNESESRISRDEDAQFESGLPGN